MTDEATATRVPLQAASSIAPRLRADITWAYCCPVCADSAEPGEALGWYTAEGLKQHKWDVHGEAS